MIPHFPKPSLCKPTQGPVGLSWVVRVSVSWMVVNREKLDTRLPKDSGGAQDMAARFLQAIGISIQIWVVLVRNWTRDHNIWSHLTSILPLGYWYQDKSSGQYSEHDTSLGCSVFQKSSQIFPIKRYMLCTYIVSKIFENQNLRWSSLAPQAIFLFSGNL